MANVRSDSKECKNPGEYEGEQILIEDQSGDVRDLTLWEKVDHELRSE